MSSKIDKIYKQAKAALSSNDKIRLLLEQTVQKLNDLGRNDQDRDHFVSKVQALIRMIRYHYTGEYRAFSTKTLLTFVFGLFYFITPVDMIPDIIPILGLTDDVTLLYWIFKNFADDIEHFLQWEKGAEISK
ncbi:MAG: DUF1232 domain-containing protein [Cyclobacteriaceae bacterium]|nr:DUF1232 domain-containing protein [Cyclobacteriaceae bacterium HetDA_MAG_MS6]